MAGRRDPPRGLDPDDWFAGSGRAAPRSSGGTATPEAQRESAANREQPGAPDDWLDDEPVTARAERFLADLNLSRRTGIAIGVIVVVLIIVAGLAVGGVFSGSSQNQATTSTTTPATTTAPTTTPQTTPTTVPAPTTTLKPGDQGAQVKLLQRALARLGYASGVIDGDYGPSTQNAVTRFQRASGLTADGVVGPKTLAALKQALQTHR